MFLGKHHLARPTAFLALGRHLSSPLTQPTPFCTMVSSMPDLTGIHEIVLSQQVADQLEEMGMSQDEFVAMLLKHAKATQ